MHHYIASVFQTTRKLLIGGFRILYYGLYSVRLSEIHSFGSIGFGFLETAISDSDLLLVYVGKRNVETFNGSLKYCV